MSDSPFRTPTALLPVAMSLGALAMLLAYVALFGVVHHEDEGTPAHIFQLLMVGQLPLIVAFASRWLPRAPRQALLVLALQALAALIAIGAVVIFESR